MPLIVKSGLITLAILAGFAAAIAAITLFAQNFPNEFTGLLLILAASILVGMLWVPIHGELKRNHRRRL